MQRAPLPPDEPQRLEALRALNILDTPPEERFDRVTRLARRLFGVPIALVSMVDSERQWFKSKQGIDATETPRDISFCGHAILSDEVMVVEDALADQRFFDNPFVLEDPKIRFYAGCPVHAADGSRVGTLCIIDTNARTLDETDRKLLADLAAMVEAEFQALELASVDAMTGLSNRRGFEAIAHHTLALSRRMGRPVTLLFLDLDNLKEINDEGGHGEGDRILVEMSRLLVASFRDSDVIARIGGDEFCVLLSGASESDVVRPLFDLREKIAQRNASRHTPHELSISVGAATFDPDRHATIEDLLRDADGLMYHDKRRGASDEGDDAEGSRPPAE